MSHHEYDRGKVQRAIIRWRGFDTRSSTCIRDFYEFAAFLGYPHVVGQDRIVDTTNPEVTRLIDLILGPNGNTILAMMKARKSDE